MKAQQKGTIVFIGGVEYIKSSFSDWEKHCVGVHVSDNRVSVINTSIPNSPILEFSHEECQAFLSGVKNEEFELNY